MAASGSFLYLSEVALGGLGITVEETVEAIESMFQEHEKGRAWWASKATIEPPDGRYLMATMAAAENPSILVNKTLVLNGRNSDSGLPQINGLITALDSESGLPLAVVDCNWITAVRTAALSVVAAKRLARPDASVAGFIGCGVQAMSHLDAFTRMYPLREVRMFGRGRANIEALSKAAEERGLTVTVQDRPRAVVEEADLLVTSVTYSAAMEPFLDASWMKPGSFATVTDLAAPWDRESFSSLDRIIVDDTAQEMTMPVKLADPAIIGGDMADLVNGKIEGRTTDEQRTAFVFRAHAIGDLALTSLAYQKAIGNSRGLEITG